MSTLTFEVDSQTVVVDTDELLGELTLEEFALLMGYVRQSGLDSEQAMAGGYVLVLLSRKVELSTEELLEAVTSGR
jgi:hypothetical protein